MREEMKRRLIGAAVLVFCGFMASNAPAGAWSSAPTTHQKPTNWGHRDTAVYVVSTLNLLHTKNGKPMPLIFQQSMGVARFDVYADQNVTDMYFIQLKREDGAVVAAFAYAMGWSKPKLVYISSRKFGHARAPLKVVVAYKSDVKQLIGSFTSTFPV
ncbi:MAG: hypothetical protein NVSMB52_00530 [Chloroflexota bacterium]